MTVAYCKFGVNARKSPAIRKRYFCSLLGLFLRETVFILVRATRFELVTFGFGG